jgi:hypothetical protein
VITRFLPIAIAFVSLESCKPRDFGTNASSSSQNSGEIKITGKEIIGFNWSNSSENIQQHFRNSVNNAHKNNITIKTPEEIPNGLTMGHGLYIASDPLQSAVYGKELFCAALKKNASWRPAFFESLEAIHSSAAVLRYPFAIGILPIPTKDSFEWAAVIRDFDAFEINRSRKISFQKSGSGSGLQERSLTLAKETLERQDICEFLAAFEGEFLTLFYSLHAASPHAQYSWMTTLAPLFRATIGTQGVSFGEHTKEIASGIRSQPTLLADLKRAGAIKNDSDTAIITTLMDVTNTVDEELSQSPHAQSPTMPQAWQMQLLSASGLVQVHPETKTWSALRQDIEQSLKSRFLAWGSAHPAETQLMREWLQLLEKVRLSSL